MVRSASHQPDLFGATASPAARLPDGLRYQADFLTPAEEAELLAHVEALPLEPMRYLDYTALRRVVSYGGRYDFSARRLEATEPIPQWLRPLCRKAGEWAGIDAESFTQALVAEYRPGTPLGWHRDVPDFEDVIGVSLLDAAVMRFRPYPPHGLGRADTVKLALAPRSIYLLRGAARWGWQHGIVATKVLRYSITLRTSRAPGG
jgi:alkylated DNA repair dioxygenase AlkB